MIIKLFVLTAMGKPEPEPIDKVNTNYIPLPRIGDLIKIGERRFRVADVEFQLGDNEQIAVFIDEFFTSIKFEH